LSTLYLQKQITLEVALARSSNPDELQEMINRGASLAGRQAASASGKR
jgi:twitching motility protein PilT